MYTIMFTLIFSFFFTSLIYCSSPLWMLFFLVTQTLFVTFYLALMSKAVWLSYFLFLMILGGLIVVFSYLSIMIPSDPLDMTPEYMILTLFMGIIFSGVDFYSQTELVLLGSNYMSAAQVFMIFSVTNSFVYFVLAMYLFFALIYLVNLMKVYEGPLRFYN